MEALINEAMVMRLLSAEGRTANYYNVNPGILSSPASEHKVPVWYVLDDSGEEIFYKFRNGEKINFPDAGDFSVLNRVGTCIEFPDGETFYLSAYELAYKKCFVPGTSRKLLPLKVYNEF